MASYRKRRSSRKPKSRKGTKRRSHKSYGRTKRKFRKAYKHKKISRQRIRTLLPDVAIAKLKWFTTGVNLSCTDLTTDLVNSGGTPNFMKIHLNSNPNGGLALEHGSANVGATYNPVQTYNTKYQRYRCHGVSVKVSVITQDNGLVDPASSVSNTQIATPVLLTGFPYQSDDASLANYWLDSTSGGYTANTIPAMKYGFKRMSPGLGGKSAITYKTYWSIPKIFGQDETQWLADDRYAVSTANGVKPP